MIGYNLLFLKKIWFQLFFLLCFFLLILPSAQSRQATLADADRKLLESLRITPATIWIEAHNFSGELPDGKTARLEDYQGRFVLLNFWATWCSPCLKEIPAFVEFYKENSEHVEILGLDFEPVNIELINEFVERFSINYPLILYTHINDSEYTKFGEIVGMPTTLIYSPDGELLQTFMGEITIEDLKKYIPPLT